MRTQMFKNQNEYFDDLNKNTQDLIKDLIIQHSESIEPCGWKPLEDCIESLECKRRDGFIPFSHNKGGLLFRNFSTLMDYYGGGIEPKNKDAALQIQKQIEISVNLAKEEFTEKHKSTDFDLEDDNYFNLLHEYLADDSSSIMHEIRFMYHGIKNKKHSASVSVALNTEAPYHRSSIAWAPEVFCEAAEEIEITWTNDKDLKTKLNKVLKKLVSEMF